MASLVRFVHAAQARLDVPISGFFNEVQSLPGSARVSLEDASLDAFDQLVEKARELEADALLLVGNTLRAADRSLRARRRLEEGVARLDSAGIPCVICCGPLDPASTYKALALPESATVLSARSPRGRVQAGRSEIEFVLAGPDATDNDRDLWDRSGSNADVTVAVVPPDRDSELTASESERASRRFDPPHGAARGRGIAYWALGNGVPTSTSLNAALAHDPGPLTPPSAGFSGSCGASLVEVDASGGVRTSSLPCSPVRCETVTLSLDGIRSLEGLAQAMADRMPRPDRSVDLSVLTWRLAGRSPVFGQLDAAGAWQDVISLADDSDASSRIHLRRHEPAADSFDEVASMLADEYRELIAQVDPDPRDQVDVESPDLERLLQAAAASPRTWTRIREIGPAVFSADCDDLWKAA